MRWPVRTVWHRWFAWRPVPAPESGVVVWLEWVERKDENIFGIWVSEYRVPTEPAK